MEPGQQIWVNLQVVQPQPPMPVRRGTEVIGAVADTAEVARVAAASSLDFPIRQGPHPIPLLPAHIPTPARSHLHRLPLLAGHLRLAMLPANYGLGPFGTIATNPAATTPT
jgi:hypothetical protein